MSDIFISYASADRPRVMPLVDELQRRGWSVWWDRTIRPGKTWDQVIEAALDEARCVVVLWSRDSVQSDWVRTEADEARQRGILVPALLDDVAIPLAFRRMQAARLVQWSSGSANAEFDELIRAVTEVLYEGAPPAPEIKPRPAAVPPPMQLSERVPIATRRRHVWSFGSPRRAMAAIGAALLVCVAVPAWYFASSHRENSARPGSSWAPSQVREEARAEVALPRPVSSKPAAVAATAERSNEPRKDSAAVSPGPGASSAPSQVREEARAEAALPPPVSSKPLAVIATAERSNEPRRDSAAVGSRQPRNNARDGLKYVWIPPGTFTMGCSPGDSECDSDEKPAHQVTITAGFWMGQTPVTQEAYQRVTGKDPSHFKGPQLPVETVNWNEAKSYCDAVGMRLPTEAEWEYAARAGTTGSRYGDLDSIAWYSANSGSKTHEVAQKQPNAWGLYDMLGNVWQWTADWYADKYSGNSDTDPRGPASGTLHPLRGGSWFNFPTNVRVSFRYRYVPENRVSLIGLRCVGN